eukprot:Seg2115.2 transcript_id=Seg2115.2/GoldUCD/mRNA.D3Y31 product="hypothetical protein" protein_id=Seg2115.2/GoldUCD/D3Y31
MPTGEPLERVESKDCSLRIEGLQRRKATYWLEYQAINEGITIEHALTKHKERTLMVSKLQREKYSLLPRMIKLDGWCSSTNTAYEFHGCYWHACERCDLFKAGMVRKDKSGRSWLPEDVRNYHNQRMNFCEKNCA